MPTDPTADPLSNTPEEAGSPKPNGSGTPPTPTEWANHVNSSPTAPQGDIYNTAPQPIVTASQAQRVEEGEQAGSAATLPLDTETLRQSPDTEPLSEAGAPPTPPLEPKAVAGGRYRIAELLGSAQGMNVYRATDLEGYRRCWACGSDASMEGDTYCVECGAQLTERYYRLQEFNAPTESPGDGSALITLVPQPVLDNAVPGVAHVYDAFEETETGRAYIVWEEVYGRTLASWLEGEAAFANGIAMTMPQTSGALPSMDAPGEEQALAWMTQAATLLAELHSHGVTGCNLSLENLAVEPGDRVVLLTSTGCRLSEDDRATQSSDVRVLASELERWYVQVRGEGDGQAIAETPGAGGGGLIASVDEVTGPLMSPSNPTSVLTKAKEGVFATAAELAGALQELYEASRPVTGLYLWSGRASDVGRVRQINEDSLLTLEAMVIEHGEQLPIGVYVVADGMGGHQSGEVASAIAVRTIGAIVNSALIGPLVAGDPVAHDASTCANLLQQAVLEANRRITQLARERHSDLGTTVTAALVLGSNLTVANVGDSRTYVWRNGQLAVITRDHSFVAQLVAAGQIAPSEIYTHPRRNEIYRALGDPNLTANEVDTFSHHLLPGDGILLCSDGLWDFVRDPSIATTLSDQEMEPSAICRSLVDQANSAGGEDNITTIYVRVMAKSE